MSEGGGWSEDSTGSGMLSPESQHLQCAPWLSDAHLDAFAQRSRSSFASDDHSGMMWDPVSSWKEKALLNGLTQCHPLNKNILLSTAIYIYSEQKEREDVFWRTHNPKGDRALPWGRCDRDDVSCGGDEVRE